MMKINSRPLSSTINLFSKLYVLSIFILCTLPAIAQKVDMSFNYDKIPASKVIDDIEKKTRFRFLFNRETIDVNFNVSLVGKYTNLSDVLNGLFSSTDLGYTILDDQIILTLKKQAISMNKVYFTAKVVDENSEPLPGANVCENGLKLELLQTEMAFFRYHCLISIHR